MKVLHLVSHLDEGGITHHLLNLLPQLKKLGCQTFVWGAGGRRADELSSVADGVFRLGHRTKNELSPILWARLPRLVWVLKQNKIDLMHAHTRITQVLAAAASALTGIPIVTTAHGFYQARLGRRLAPCWGRMIFAISPAVQEGLKAEFGETRLPPIRLVENGIDRETLLDRIQGVDRNQVRKKLGYADEDCVFLSISRLQPSKGLHLLIDSFAHASCEEKSLKLLIGGDGRGQYSGQLKAQAAKLGVSDQIQFLGQVRDKEVYLGASDSFVAPYLPPEGFSLSVLEAMTAGLPVIATQTGGITRLLEHGASGALFDQGNTEQLSKLLIRYGKDKKLRQEIGRKAFVSSEKYSSKQMAELVCKAYQEIIHS